MKTTGLGLVSALLAILAGCPASTSTLQQGASSGRTSRSSGRGSSRSTSSGPSSSGATTSGGSTGSNGSSSSGSTGSTSSSSTGRSSSGSTGSTSPTSGGSSSGGSSGSACVPPPSDGGCWSEEPDGGPCVTLADCAAGLVCSGPTDCATGSCRPPGATPTLACTPNGQACGPDLPQCCGGQCRDAGVCLPWTPCGEGTASCLTDLDCCNAFTCQGGNCQPTCQQIYGPCQSSADCCYDDGLACVLPPGATAAVCLPANLFQPYNGSTPVLCGAPCSGWECQLGAACQLGSTGVDPCAAAGEVCDKSYNVCRNPRAGNVLNAASDPCLPSGPPCLPTPDSNAQAVCVPTTVDGGSYCEQPCATSADCINPLRACFADPAGGGSRCAFGEYCQPSQFFGPCDVSDAGDGLCIPYDFGSGPSGVCGQATLDGGAAGDRCLFGYAGNRQVGGLCDNQDLCGAGLCAPACNDGTSGVPGCAAGQRCFTWTGVVGQPIEMGFCSPACDFTAPDGGGCPNDSTGVPEKCFPEVLFDLVDSPTGICGSGAVAPLPIGSVCPFSADGQLEAAGDPCVNGAYCIGDTALATLRTCIQLCDRVGQNAGCPTGQLCQALIVAGLPGNPAHSGYCK